MATEVKKYLHDYFPPDTRSQQEVVESLINVLGTNLGITKDNLLNIEKAEYVMVDRKDGILGINKTVSDDILNSPLRRSFLGVKESDISDIDIPMVFPMSFYTEITEGIYFPSVCGLFEGYRYQSFELVTDVGFYLHITEIINKSKNLDYPVQSVRIIRDKSKGRKEVIYGTVGFTEPWVTQNFGITEPENEAIRLVFINDRVFAVSITQILAELSIEEVKSHGLIARLKENNRVTRFFIKHGEVGIDVVQGKKLNPGYAEDMFTNKSQQWITNDSVNLVDFPVFSKS